MSKDDKSPPLSQENEAFLKRLADKPADAATLTSVRKEAGPALKSSEMHEINRDKRVSAEESKAVKSDFEKMMPDYPNKTSCYAAVAILRGMKPGRVRYIIEGDRRKRK